MKLLANNRQVMYMTTMKNRGCLVLHVSGLTHKCNTPPTHTPSCALCSQAGGNGISAPQVQATHPLECHTRSHCPNGSFMLCYRRHHHCGDPPWSSARFVRTKYAQKWWLMRNQKMVECISVCEGGCWQQHTAKREIKNTTLPIVIKSEHMKSKQILTPSSSTQPCVLGNLLGTFSFAFLSIADS